LFLEWINAVIYEMATHNMVFGRFEVHVGRNRLRAVLYGEALNQARHRPALEPKGVSRTGARVSREPDGSWLANCLLET
jgi:SHS2 domain-containing protein